MQASAFPFCQRADAGGRPVVYGGDGSAATRRAFMTASAWPAQTPIPDKYASLSEADDLVAMLVDMGLDDHIVQAKTELSAEIERDTGAPTLRTLRLRQGLSQQELADAVGSVQVQISRLETGRQEMGLAFAARLAKALDVDVTAIECAVRAGAAHAG